MTDYIGKSAQQAGTELHAEQVKELEALNAEMHKQIEVPFAKEKNILAEGQEILKKAHIIPTEEMAVFTSPEKFEEKLEELETAYQDKLKPKEKVTPTVTTPTPAPEEKAPTPTQEAPRPGGDREE